MRKLTQGIVAVAALMAASVASAGVYPGDVFQAIDNFDQTGAIVGGTQNVGGPNNSIVNGYNASPGYAQYQASGALGGYRDVTVLNTGGQGTASVNQVGLGYLRAANTFGTTDVYLTWDGSTPVGATPAGLSHTGLGGVDLGTVGIVIGLVGGNLPLGTSAQLTIWNSGTAYSATNSLTGAGLQYFSFDQFGLADFANVGAVQLHIFGPSSPTGLNPWGIQADYIDAVPAPAPLALMGLGLMAMGWVRKRLHS